MPLAFPREPESKGPCSAGNYSMAHCIIQIGITSFELADTISSSPLCIPPSRKTSFIPPAVTMTPLLPTLNLRLQNLNLVHRLRKSTHNPPHILAACNCVFSKFLSCGIGSCNPMCSHGLEMDALGLNSFKDVRGV